jgi:HPt (histidine-containing phosphotransfer) domain-containing protein
VGNLSGPGITEAMNRLWVKFLPQIEQRVGTLEAAAACLAAGTLSGAQREAASAEAHKLAGVLGTFGLQEGTVLAREAEAAYLVERQTDPALVARMAEIAGQLRIMLARRNDPSSN